MTDYGDTAYPIIISDAINSGAPSGNLIYLLTTNLNCNDQPMTRARHFYKGKTHKINFGKRVQTCQITDALVLNTNINNVKTIFRKSNRYAGTQLYVWVKIESTPTYFTWEKPYVNETINEVNYLYAWIERGPAFKAPTTNSKYWHLSIAFEEGWEE